MQKKQTKPWLQVGKPKQRLSTARGDELEQLALLQRRHVGDDSPEGLNVGLPIRVAGVVDVAGGRSRGRVRDMM